MGSPPTGPSLLRPRILAAITVAILAGILLGVVLGSPLLDAGDGPAVTEPVQFSGVTESYDDRIVFRFTPDVDAPREYRVSYELSANGTTVESVTNETRRLSAETPLVVTVEDRQTNVAYAIEVTIERDGRVVHDARVVVSRQPPD